MSRKPKNIGQLNQYLPQYFFIELITWFQGKIKVADIQQQFGISRASASKHLNAYEKINPGAFIKSQKTHRRTASQNMALLFISGHVDQYLTWLDTGGLLPNEIQTPERQIQQLPVPTRNINPTIIRPLVQAINESQRLEVDYLSLSRPVNDGRVIAPHSFVKTNLRWHVRAWDEGSKRFADFNLSRFRGEPELSGNSDKSSKDDHGWNQIITLKLRPDTRLEPEKQAIIAQDYEMVDGELHIQTRACLATYLLQELRVSVKMVDALPEAQQLELVNKEEIKAWLFDT